MARGPLRHVEERIKEIVGAAKEMNFKLIVGDPVIGPMGIFRSEPPIKPGQPAQLTFYIGKVAWERYREAYFIDQQKDDPHEGIDLSFYQPLKDGAEHGAQPEGEGTVSGCE